MYILPEDAFRMHRDHFKEIALSCIYKEEIAKRQQEVGEVTETAKNFPAEAGNKEEKEQKLPCCRVSSPNAKK
jgi:hypothetical protein